MMIQLPKEFIHTTKALMGEERFERYLHSFEEETPVSIRLNPMKLSEGKYQMDDAVPWCRNAYYLAKRPNFTFDPLFHAGCYYVQEAASMFLDEVLCQLSIINCQLSIDLCAAPGGKSTLLRSALPADCVLYSNEPMQKRASILLENVLKWGYKNHHVTNLYPRDYRKSKMKFDLILCDVPCSGEGMFRKDEATIKEWSPQNVEKCWQLQREIVSDAWACLNDGGILIYSTCTFNTKENEENVRWILSEFDAEVVPIETKPEWQITGSLLEGFNEPVYRFIPGITRSEGLFMCVIRKKGEREELNEKCSSSSEQTSSSCDRGIIDKASRQTGMPCSLFMEKESLPSMNVPNLDLYSLSRIFFLSPSVFGILTRHPKLARKNKSSGDEPNRKAASSLLNLTSASKLCASPKSSFEE